MGDSHISEQAGMWYWTFPSSQVGIPRWAGRKMLIKVNHRKRSWEMINPSGDRAKLLTIIFISVLISSTADRCKLLWLFSLSARLAKFARFVCPLLLLAPVVVAPVRCLSMIEIDQNRSESIITRNRAINLYWHPILDDWLIPIFVDYRNYWHATSCNETKPSAM